MAKTVVIIGGGVAGLSAGIHAQLSGLESIIVERHHILGGLCTAWDRKGYHFEGCLHYIVGFSERYHFHEMWKDLGMTREPYFPEDIGRIQTPDGQEIVMYTDSEVLRDHWCSISPSDEPLINQLVRWIKLCTYFNPPINKPMEKVGLRDLLHLRGQFFAFSRMFFHLKKQTCQEFANKFCHPGIRQLLTQANGFGTFPLIWLVMILSRLSIRDAGFPLGGSTALIEDLEKRYRSLGGKVRYRCEAAEVVVEQNTAVGVKLTTGEVIKADEVISSGDYRYASQILLGDKHTPKVVKKMLEQKEIYPSYIQISLGVATDLRRRPHTFFVREMPESNLPIGRMVVKHYSFDSSMGSSHQSTVIALIDTEYSYWKSINTYEKQESYNKKKQAILDYVLPTIYDFYPEIKGKVEVTDIATPTTYERYTFGWEGSCQGWLANKSNFGRVLPSEFPSLKHFSLCGQWLVPGGSVHRSAQTGRYVVGSICKRRGWSCLSVSTSTDEQLTELRQPTRMY